MEGLPAICYIRFMSKPIRFRFLPDSNGWDFSSEWPEMPRDPFNSEAEAREAAKSFVSRWSAGGYEIEADAYWARDDVGNDQFRSTRFVIDGIR